MTVIKDNGDGTTSSFGFVAPAGVSDKLTEVLFPVSDAQSKDYAASIALTVKQMVTQVIVGTLTGDLTLTAAVNAQVTKGALILIKATADTSVRIITFHTGFVANKVIVPASTTVYLLGYYDGTSIVVTNAEQVPSFDAQSVAYAAAIAIAVKAKKTYVTVAQMTGALTLTVTANAAVPAGAELFVELPSDGTARDTTLSTGFSGATVAGVISKTKVATFVWNGTAFKHTGTQQIN